MRRDKMGSPALLKLDTPLHIADEFCKTGGFQRI